tara:strand:+ start:466 stop:2172 length:1707 start_codon:yes stop_codon:yes gene_type:complete
LKIIRFALIPVVNILLIAGCINDLPYTPKGSVATSIALSQAEISIGSLGQHIQLSATVEDQTGTTMSGAIVTWQTSDPQVAIASASGLVTSVANGATVVTASSGSASATVAVTVLQVTANIELSDTALAFSVLGDTAQLAVTVKDQIGATVNNPNVTWTTSDPAVATVSASGLVTSLENGTTTIKVSSGSLNATSLVTVTVWKSISVGGAHVCGLTTDGKAYCWGKNDYGQLGGGNTTNLSNPGLVEGGHTWESISARWSHACALKANDRAYCWGWNYIGQLGDGTKADRLSPTSVTGGVEEGGYSFKSIATGGNHTCALKADGKAYCWGYNRRGQLGDGTGGDDTHNNDRLSPTLVAGGHSFESISGGRDHACGLKADGKAYCWGFNQYGQLGDGTNLDHKSVPTLVVGGYSFESISAGGNHTCGVATDGKAYCWGFNSSGQLGELTTTNLSSPNLVVGWHTWQSISAGGNHTCGVATDGKTYCWGNNEYGQLGNGKIGITTNRAIPTFVEGGHTWQWSYQSISSGYSHTCGLATDNKAYCWGNNEYGQLGDGTTTDRLQSTGVVIP